MIKTKDLLDLSHSVAGEYICRFEFPWQSLAGIKEFILTFAKSLDKNEYYEISQNIWIHKSVDISENVSLNSPCIIGEGTEIRHGAFIRGSAIIGKNCVVGNSAEIKNAILFDGVQVPHYNYVGDSILGYKAHMGAGAITSNVKSDKSLVTVKNTDGKTETGLKKFGAIIGDFAEIGCNSVLNPGTVIGRNSIVYPLSCVRGTVESDCIYKTNGVTVKKR